MPEIRLLGAFGASVDGVDVDERGWRLRKARTLVKLLALQPGRRLHREQAMQVLWPELDPGAAQNNLHGAIHAARRVLGPAGIAVGDGVLALEAETQVDVEAFEQAARHARTTAAVEDLSAAVAAYTGELLPEDRYEPWSEPRRAALRELHSSLCLQLAALQASAGRSEDAVSTLQRAISHDPLNEAAHRALMRVYEDAGRRQDALAQYGRLRAALRSELEADPDPETRRLYRQLLAGAEPEVGPAPDGEAVPALAPEPSLPVQLTTFVGRDRELTEVVHLLERARLVTLTGPGGSGKTRLAIAAAARSVAAYPEGIWLVELGAISDPALVGDAAAAAVGIRAPSQRAAADALVDHLTTRRALLVLDTCEHVVDACAVLSETLLRGCPQVTVLATSREPLRATGETTWRVPGLGVPRPDERDPAAIAAFESVQLFAERARSAAREFALTTENARDVASICFRLDGMPLAIELAAARVPMLGPAHIADRLGDSLEVLVGGSRTGLTRQQTLRATIEWSHELLDPEERLLFRRLAVFAGSFPLDAVEDVCPGGELARSAVLGILGRLVDKSLVVVDDAGAARYRLLDTIRQFAYEELARAGEQAALEARHRSWAQSLAEAHDPATLRGTAGRSLRRLESDHDNIRSALATGLRDEPDAALLLAATVWRFWLDRNYFTEGARRLATALERTDGDSETRVRALLAAAALGLRRGDNATQIAGAREAVAVARRLGDVVLVADTLQAAALPFVPAAEPAESMASSAEALELLDGRDGAREAAVRASALHGSSLLHFYNGDLGEARSRIDAAIAELDAVSDDLDPFFEGMTLGYVVLPEGPGGALRPTFEETILLFHRFARAEARAYALCNKAVVERSAGQRDIARALLDEALDSFRQLGDGGGEALALTGLGHWARTYGEPELGERALERALGLRRARGDRRAVAMTETALAVLLARTGQLERARPIFDDVYTRFRAADDAPGFGGVLINRAVSEELAGDGELAAELLEHGAAIWERHVYGHLPGWAWLAAADMRSRLGDAERCAEAAARAVRLLEAAGDGRGAALARGVCG